MKMAKISILIVSLPYLLCAMVGSNRQPSPCSEYFTYMTKLGITDMLGQIEIPSPSVNDTFFLKVALDTTTEWPSQLVRLEMAQSIKASVGRVRRGRPLLYHVYYPTHEPIPSLSAIWFNNRRYCPGSKVRGNIAANVELGHILYPPNEEPFVYSDGPWQHVSQQWHRNISQYRIDNPSYDRLNYDYGLNNECGITTYYSDDTNRLIPNGEKTYPGQWPWLVAIYTQNIGNENEYKFTCAGSILTTRHVITGTYCITMWNKAVGMFTLIEPRRVYVSFGQFNSREWHENHTGIINRVIANYTYSHGLAILNLKTAIEYNGFIRPICLWSGSTNLRDIFNVAGYVVGWGEDVNRNTSLSDDHSAIQMYTGEPRMTQVSILLSVFYEPDKNDGLFTVGLQSHFHEVPCDHGGGIVFFNITTGRYQLRGVELSCFPSLESSSLIYIDVAERISWIRQQISST